MLFDFLNMQDNYDERKVAHDEVGDWVVDTSSVNDGAQPYETAVKSPEYNDGKWVIVEAYPTKEAALAGHAKWTAKGNDQPGELIDCANSSVRQLIGPETFPRRGKK